MNPNSQPMNMKQMSIGQKIDLVAAILSYPALTILMFVRRRVGYRTLRPFQIVLMFLLMQNVPLLFDQHCTLVNGCTALPDAGLSTGYYYFSWAILIGGFLQRWLRWFELTHGRAWHSYSRGVSYFEFLSRFRFTPGNFISFIPKSIVLRIPISIIYRLVDAAFVMCLAMLIGDLPGMKGLARWLFFSGACMMFVENYVFDKQLDRELDLLDAMVEGEIHASLAQKFSGAPQGQRAAPGVAETAGMPTGIGPDIARQVDARRKTGHGLAPDNLATV